MLESMYKYSTITLFVCLNSLLISNIAQAQSWRSDWNYSLFPPYPNANQHAQPYIPHAEFQPFYPMHPGHNSNPLQKPAKQSLPVSKTSRRKLNFVSQIKPIIEQENKRLINQRYRLINILILLNRGYQLRAQDEEWLVSMSEKYKIKGNPLQDVQSREALLDKVDIIPVSLALAQAANESAWGQSRFSREANNLFGIWTYDRNKGLIPKHRDENKKHLVRKFDSMDESIQYYMQTLNSHPAYKKMRRIRKTLRIQQQPITGEALANGLEKYSEKGNIYVQLIKKLIEQNEWHELDRNV